MVLDGWGFSTIVTLATGQPVTPAIVWQDRRTAAFCRDVLISAQRSRDRIADFHDMHYPAASVRVEFLRAESDVHPVGV